MQSDRHDIHEMIQRLNGSPDLTLTYERGRDGDKIVGWANGREFKISIRDNTTAIRIQQLVAKYTRSALAQVSDSAPPPSRRSQTLHWDDCPPPSRRSRTLLRDDCPSPSARPPTLQDACYTLFPAWRGTVNISIEQVDGATRSVFRIPCRNGKVTKLSIPQMQPEPPSIDEFIDRMLAPSWNLIDRINCILFLNQAELPSDVEVKRHKNILMIKCGALRLPWTPPRNDEEWDESFLEALQIARSTPGKQELALLSPLTPPMLHETKIRSFPKFAAFSRKFPKFAPFISHIVRVAEGKICPKGAGKFDPNDPKFWEPFRNTLGLLIEELQNKAETEPDLCIAALAAFAPCQDQCCTAYFDGVSMALHHMQSEAIPYFQGGLQDHIRHLACGLRSWVVEQMVARDRDQTHTPQLKSFIIRCLRDAAIALPAEAPGSVSDPYTLSTNKRYWKNPEHCYFGFLYLYRNQLVPHVCEGLNRLLTPISFSLFGDLQTMLSEQAKQDIGLLVVTTVEQEERVQQALSKYLKIPPLTEDSTQFTSAPELTPAGARVLLQRYRVLQ